MDAPSPGALRPPGPWQMASVEEVIVETKSAKTFRLRLALPTGHLAGQHYIVRLSAPDGYRASRSYSVASAPETTGKLIELTVERLEGGEVSSFLHEVVVPGDLLEVRGPIGGFFVWRGDTPALLVGGGSGIVPLMAMLRLARSGDSFEPVRLVVSVREPGDLYYQRELPGPETTLVYTRKSPPGAKSPPGHIGLAELRGSLLPNATAYVCGSSGFADHVTGLLAQMGVASGQIRVERFGPTT
jgi:ferredoxin-NADP reductase